MVTHLLPSCGRDNLKKFHWNCDGKKFRIGNACLFIGKQGLFLPVHVDGIKMTGRWQNMAPMWKELMKLVDLGEPTSFLDHVYLGCTQLECESNENIIEENEKTFESRMSAEQ